MAAHYGVFVTQIPGWRAVIGGRDDVSRWETSDGKASTVTLQARTATQALKNCDYTIELELIDQSTSSELTEVGGAAKKSLI
ncbi:hypothetical protein MTO96_034336 [Rhipicephalus appendiculatus]